MRLGPFRLTRRRALRALAGVVAGLLLTGNVLAAAGMCTIVAPAGSHGAAQAVAHDGASSNPCPQHLSDEAAPGGGTSPHHCPSHDPSAQSRTVDVPGAQFMVAIAATPFLSLDSGQRTEPLFAVTHRTEPQPLYARLQRLRL